MIIEFDTEKFTIFSHETLLSALSKIDANGHGFLIGLSQSGKIEGILTDGDIRRWLTEGGEVNLDLPVSTALNTNFLALQISTPTAKIGRHFSDRICMIPLVDPLGCLVAIALPQQSGFVINGRKLGAKNPAFLIAEIGNNHNGDMDLAHRLVDFAANAGADCAKFQMRDVSTLYGRASGNACRALDLGAQYTLDLLNRFNLSATQLYELFDHCKDLAIEPVCTPWDLPSLEALELYGLNAYKVASADLTNHELLSALISTGKPLICSTGMSEEQEIRESIDLMRRRDTRFALLHCNSTYPAPYKDINLGYMQRLREIGGCVVGYSGHERGWSIPIAAVAQGASIIEKHFTTDRSMEGNDHRVSLLPDEFSAMANAIRNVEEAMSGDANKREVSQGEIINREVLAKSIHAAVDISAGEELTRSQLMVCSPGQGLQPNRLNDLLGRKALRDIPLGTPLFASDLGEKLVTPRPFTFSRPFGIPVRWHDYRALAKVSNFKFLEYHMSYQDMEANLNEYFDEPLDLDFVIHAPELFKGDHILDLSSDDENYRRRSLDEMRRVIDITCELRKWHRPSHRTLIITNVGGFDTSGFLNASEREDCYARVAQSLKELNCDEIEIIPQTMPPFPWHFGGQSYHNLFVDPSEITEFCLQHGTRICFDLSHSQLACNYFDWSMAHFIQAVGPHTAHLHIADARGVDGEGLQIGDGDMDFNFVCGELDRVCGDASFIPEIWQGHKNSGSGFWRALDALEHFFND